MKKITIVVLALLVIATCLFGCNNACDDVEQETFAFGYHIDNIEFEQGERIAITATVINISGEDYTYTGAYTDFRPNVRLHSFDDDGEIDKVINHEPVESTDDIGDRVIKDGQTVTYTYYFNIPEDAYCTDYAIYISCFGYGREIKDAIKVVTKAAQDPDDYNSEMFSEGRLYFHVSKSEALLVDSTGSLMWIYSRTDGFFDAFESGDYVKIEHGYVMESYPGQTYAESIILIEDGDIYSFTDEEWEGLSWVFAEPPER